MEENYKKQIDHIQEVLSKINFPARYNTEQTVICILALIADIKLDGLIIGKQKLRDGARIRNILDFKRNILKEDVAENTRESYRKQSLKPLYELGIVEKHQSSINDPNTHYTINPKFEEILKATGRKQAGFIKSWNKTHRIKLQRLQEVRSATDVRIEQWGLSLSAGKHNELAKDILEIFAPSYIHHFSPVYVGDTRNKMLFVNQEVCKKLNLELDKHDQLPDVIVYNDQTNILYIIESVTSVGPVNETRKEEIKRLLTKKLKKLTYGLVLITAFPDRKTFRRFVEEIAWGTKVWIAEEHFGIIHFELIHQSL
ncbi:hypothetical protein KKA87_06895 [bacterium]|nr:hypothetical protein [bacterium]